MKRLLGMRAPAGRAHSGEEGAALVLALVVTALVLSLGLILVELATSQLRLAASRRDAALALNAAEAGLHLALDRLTRGEEVPTSGTGRLVLTPGVDYEVSLFPEAKEKKEGRFTVTADGYAGRAHRRVVAEVAVQLGPPGQGNGNGNEPPGQDKEKDPPGQGDDWVPPGQEDKEPPGQDKQAYSVEVLSWREGS